MFWRKKKKRAKRKAGGSQNDPDNRRRHYRRALSKKHGLGVQVRNTGALSVNGDLIDISAGGAAAVFRSGSDPLLPAGSATMLVFTTLGRQGEIQVLSKVASTLPVEEGVKYRFEFTDLPGLFAQLDEYYVRFFNRRKFLRVRPALDQRVDVTVDTVNGEVVGKMYDLTRSGVGIELDADKANRLAGAQELVLRFKIRGIPIDFQLKAIAVHITPSRTGFVLGARIVPMEQDPEFEAQCSAIDEYASKRADEIARWDAAGQ